MDDSLCVLLTSIYVVVFVGLVFWSNKKPKPAPEKKVEKFVYTHDEFMRDMLGNVPLEVIMDRCRAVGGVPRRLKKEKPVNNSSSLWGNRACEPRYDYFGAELNITNTAGMGTSCTPTVIKITLDSSGQI